MEQFWSSFKVCVGCILPRLDQCHTGSVGQLGQHHVHHSCRACALVHGGQGPQVGHGVHQFDHVDWNRDEMFASWHSSFYLVSLILENDGSVLRSSLNLIFAGCAIFAPF